MPPSSRRSHRTPAVAQPGRRLNLRLSTLVAALFLSVAAVALAYVTGVMLGRASINAERAAAAAALAQAAGQRDTDAAAKAEGGQGAMPDAAPDRSMAESEAAHPGRKILAAEELRFARALRNEEERGAAAKTVTPPQTPPLSVPLTPGISGTGPGAVPGVAGTTAQGMQDVRTDVRPDVPHAAAVSQASGSGPGMVRAGQQAAVDEMDRQQADTVRDYVFQVGAFRDEASVDALRERLEGYGLRTRMQREGKLLVVLVLVRGTPARASEVVTAAEALRLGAPILRSSRPVTPQAGSR